jgi:hypothetical protein
MNQVEDEFYTLCEQVSSKVESAVQLLKEARELARKSTFRTPMGLRSWDDLQETVESFIDFEAIYGDRGWSNSGCSF